LVKGDLTGAVREQTKRSAQELRLQSMTSNATAPDQAVVGTLKQIGVEQLRPGMHLHELCGSWLAHPFWRTKFTIKDDHQIRLIVDSGIREVMIDIARGDDVRQAPALRAANQPAIEATPPAAPPAPQQVPISEELKRAARICAKSKDSVVSMFEEARMGKAISAGVAGEVVEEISLSVLRNPGALISLARLKTADDYTYMHSVAVCALMVALARQLGFDEKQTREAGLAGLLHDLGKALVPMQVLNKPGKLSDDEFTVIKGHPEAGYRLLKDGGSAGEVAMDVCLHHHEKIDGSGYPHGLEGDAISRFAKMGAVCDVYDAITSNRPYKAGWDPATSLSKMKAWCAGHFDEMILHAFVKSIGIYPIGSLVRLASGRLAMVVEQSEKSLLTPDVKVFFSTKSRAHIPQELIRLSRPGGSDSSVDHEDPVQWGFKNLDKLLAV
jgi:putative nucleotidyltransferase with HDIG domain